MFCACGDIVIPGKSLVTTIHIEIQKRRSGTNRSADRVKLPFSGDSRFPALMNIHKYSRAFTTSVKRPSITTAEGREGVCHFAGCAIRWKLLFRCRSMLRRSRSSTPATNPGRHWLYVLSVFRSRAHSRRSETTATPD